MNIFWVRHGKTEYNSKKKLQGWSDSPLLEDDESIDKASKKLEGIKFDYICSSDLKRAVVTKKRILSNLNIEDIFDDEFIELREIGFGTLEGMSIEEIERKYPEFWAKFRSCSKDYNLNNEFSAENFYDVEKRVKKVLDKLKNNLNEDSNVLIVSHGKTIAVINELNVLPNNGEIIVQKY